MSKYTNINQNIDSAKLPPTYQGREDCLNSKQALVLILMQLKNAAHGIEEISSMAEASLESWGVYFKDLYSGKNLEDAKIKSNQHLADRIEKIRENYAENSVLGSNSCKKFSRY